jgi:hypothetical protein
MTIRGLVGVAASRAALAPVFATTARKSKMGKNQSARVFIGATVSSAGHETIMAKRDVWQF